MPIDYGKLKEKFDKKNQGRGDRLSLKDGENYIRLLPPSIEYMTESVDYICFEYLQHANIGVEGNKTMEVCPKTFGKQNKCPICEAAYRLYKENSVESRTLGNSIRAKKKYLFNALDLNDLDKGVQILEVGPKIYEYFVVYITNPKWGDLLDLDKGHNIVINRTPKEKTTSGYVEYSVAPDPEIFVVRNKLPKNFKEAISNLKNQVPKAKSYEELKSLLEGEEGGKLDEEASIKEQEHEEEQIRLEPKVVEKEDDTQIKVKEEKSNKHPECFGQDYGPRRDVCMKCVVKENCRDEYLKL